MPRINPLLLRHYRQKLDMSQDELGRRARIDKGTINRIEKGRSRRNPDRIITELAKVLKLDVAQLTAADAEVPGEADEGLFPRQQLNVRISIDARNAFALVGQRYDVSLTDLVEFAPFLFHLVAAESLKERSERLQALSAARAAVSDLGELFGHLASRMTNDWQGEEIDALEQRSIDRRDVRGDTIYDPDSRTEDPHDHDYDGDEKGPFVLYLQERLAAVKSATETDSFDGWYRHGGARYEICREQALAIFGGDEDAADDLLAGRYGVTELPKELRGPGKEYGRVAWAKEKRAEVSARADALFASLGLEIDL